MANYAKKIRTDKGDLQIDYNALANLPDLGAFDVKLTNIQSTLSSKADASDVNNMQTELSTLQTTVDGKANATDLQAAKTEILADMTGIQSTLTMLPLQYASKTTVDNVIKKDTDGKFYISADALPGYVTEEQLTTSLIATDTTPGVVKPGSGLDISSNGTLSVKPHSHLLEELLDIHVCDVYPTDTSELNEGHWYLIKAEE